MHGRGAQLWPRVSELLQALERGIPFRVYVPARHALPQPSCLVVNSAGQQKHLRVEQVITAKHSAHKATGPTWQLKQAF